MATNYGLCIVIASLIVVTVMVRGCAWYRNWRGGVRGSWARGSGASWAGAFAFTVTSISFCWIRLKLLGICAAGLCECVDEVVEIDAVHTVVRIQLG